MIDLLKATLMQTVEAINQIPPFQQARKGLRYKIPGLFKQSESLGYRNSAERQ